MKNKTEQIQTINHIRKPSSLYFVDRDGYLIEMDRKTKQRTRLSQIQKEKGYMYFVDQELNICKTKMHRN